MRWLFPFNCVLLSAMRGDESGRPTDKWIGKFLAHLATDRGASVYTQRNYRDALGEFARWHQDERKQSPAWDHLQRDDFRAYLRFLGRNELGRAAIQLRFSALRTFYKFLIRNGAAEASSLARFAFLV